jgi:hypothetical protein
MKRKLIVLLVFVSLLVANSSVMANGNNNGAISTEIWRAAEITLTSSANYTDPLFDNEIIATFYGPNNTVITRPGYWDGGDTWKVRFAPTLEGAWTYQISATDTNDTGLHNQTGSIQVQPYSGDLEIFKRGFLKTSDNGRYLTYNDGTPFFYLGDTHWVLPHERFDTSNAPGVASQFKYVVNKRVEQGFTVYQSEPIWQPHSGGTHSGEDEEAVANLSDGFTEADLDGFRNLDRKFAYIADSGLVHANAQVTWVADPAGSPAVYTEEYMKKIAQYWAARFGAYPVIWTIAQEIDKNSLGTYNDETIKKWYAVGEGLVEYDAYNQPIMPHMENVVLTPASGSNWSDKPYHDGWAVQWKDGMVGMPVAKDFWNHSPAKPAILYESGYDHFAVDSKEALAQAYKAFQYGMFGYGYGAGGVWNDIYSKPGDPIDYGTGYQLPARYYWWYDGANLATGDQLTSFKKFYTALDWWKLVPRFNDSAYSSFADPNRSLLSSDGQNTFVVFFFNSGTATGKLKKLEANAVYTASWFDPQTGLYYPIPTLVKSSTGTWTIPVKPSDADWVLLVKKQTEQGWLSEWIASWMQGWMLDGTWAWGAGWQDDENNGGNLDPAIQQAIIDSLTNPSAGGDDEPGNGGLPEPIASWTFDHIDADTSPGAGLGEPAQLMNGANIVQGGVVGGALDLDGVNDFAVINDNGLIGGKSQFTFSMWLQLKTLPQQNYSIIGKEAVIDTANSFRVVVNSNGGANFAMSTANNPWYSGNNSRFLLPVQTNTWMHVVVTYDGVNSKMYLNGERQTDSIDMSGSIIDTEDPIRLGFKPSSNLDYTAGMMDDLLIYDEALQDEQVQSLFQSYQNNASEDTEPPSVPGTATATVLSDSAISLSWNFSTDNTGVAGYKVYRNGTEIATVNDTFYTDNNLTASTAYVYRIAAFDAADNISELNAPVSATTLAAEVAAAPVTEAALNLLPPEGTNGWYVTPVTLTLHALDDSNSTGATRTFYRINGGSWQSYEAPIALDADGSYTIDYYSEDSAGNKEVAKSKLVQSDSTLATDRPLVSSTAQPGKPVLSHNNGHDTGLLDGDYRIDMNMWWGSHGTAYYLYENDQLIAVKLLDDHAPAVQKVSIDIAGRANGTYRYVVELANSFGTTRSEPLIVEVMHASPGKPVLSHNNWDRDGQYDITMNMWWGVNGTEFRLYENGVRIGQHPLTAQTPGAQIFTVPLSGKTPGAYVYKGELWNGVDSTFSEELTVVVQ